MATTDDRSKAVELALAQIEKQLEKGRLSKTAPKKLSAIRNQSSTPLAYCWSLVV